MVTKSKLYFRDNGLKFDGKMKNSAMHGEGKMKSINGTEYNGTFNINNKHGQGRLRE